MDVREEGRLRVRSMHKFRLIWRRKCVGVYVYSFFFFLEMVLFCCSRPLYCDYFSEVLLPMY